MHLLAAGALDAAAHVPAPSFGAFRPEVDRLRLARPGGRRLAPVVRVQGVDAGFTERSYAPGEAAELELGTDARGVSLQVYAYSTTVRGGDQDFKTSGTAMTPSVLVDWTGHRDAPSRVGVVRAGPWPSGLYFLRAAATDGRVGYAPFILRPRRFGALKSRSCCRRTRGRRTTSTTTTATAGATRGTSATRFTGSTSSGRISTSASRSATATGTSRSSRGSTDRKQVEFLSDDDLERFRPATSSPPRTTSSCSPATPST